jgi:deazaflavin-dependent oxidoreductase (nitroreductase family)
MTGLGSLLDVAKRVKPFDYPLTRDAAEIMVSMVPTDDSATETALGLTRRSPRATLEEALRCLAADGHLAPDRAGRLAPPGATTAPRPTRRGRARGWVARRVVRPIAASALFRRVGPRVFPRLDRLVHRLSGGRLVTSQLFVTSLVLTTTGRRSGAPREAPLACAVEPTGSWLVVGSNFGREQHPAWTSNLLASSTATVSYRGRSTTVTARLLSGPERDDAWQTLREVWPAYDQYEVTAGRSLRVFRLTPE